MKKLLLLFAGFLVCGALGVWGVGSYLSKSDNHRITMPDIGFESVAYGRTHGSFLDAGSRQQCALLLHGVHADRTSMIDRAKFLKTLGISSLAIDLQAHGETEGEQISFGYFESEDAYHGLRYLKTVAGCHQVIAIGVSLGGAATLLGKTAVEADALVLESVFPTIEEAVADRIEARLGPVGRLLAPLLYGQIPLRIGVPIEKLRPIESLKSLQIPVLVIGGSQDLSTKVSETRRMYQTIHSPKQLWIVEGAIHQDIYRYDPPGYESRLRQFIQTML